MNKNNYVLIQGLGLNQGGVGAAKYFAKKGNQVRVTDLKTKQELAPSIKALNKFKNIEFVLGRHREKDFVNAELIISSPAVPPNNKYVQLAREKDIPTYCPMSYFLKHKKGTVIGVTGTRGKSTTTKLIYQMIKKTNREVYFGGNIGRSVLIFLDRLTENSLSVLEISSFMLEWLEYEQKSPETAVLTNIYPDHLDRHKSMEEYIRIKTQIFRYQGQNDVAFLNLNNPYVESVKDQVTGKIKDFSGLDFNFENLKLDKFHSLYGIHNQENMKAAITVAKYLNVPEKEINQTIREFKGLYGRQMYLGEVDGIKVINDTCATIPEAVVVALERFSDCPVVLLTGGKDKRVSYQPLAEAIDKYSPKSIVMLKGSGAKKLKMELMKIGLENYKEVDSLEEGIELSMKIAEAGDILLFSPGGSSFERFANEFERGKTFDELVMSRHSN